jgi:hypothetical protein
VDNPHLRAHLTTRPLLACELPVTLPQCSELLARTALEQKEGAIDFEAVARLEERPAATRGPDRCVGLFLIILISFSVNLVLIGPSECGPKTRILSGAAIYACGPLQLHI